MALAINDGTIAFAEPPLFPANPKVGQTLIASAAAVGAKGPVTHEWTRDGIRIPGAIGREYVTTAADAFSQVKPVVTSVDGTKPAIAAVLPQFQNRIANFTIALDGVAKVGQPCTFTVAGDFGQPAVRFKPIWKVDGVTVGTNFYYTFKAADLNKGWTLTVNGVSVAGTHTPATLSGTVGAAGTKVATGPKNPSFAYNLNGFNDYNPEAPVLDWVKDCRYLFTKPPAVSGGQETTFFPTTGLDAKGWPTNGLPEGAARLRMLWAKNVGPIGDFALAVGPFRVTWEGSFNPTGTVNCSITNKDDTARTATLTITGAGNIFIDFTTLEAGANYMRNVRIVPQRWAAAYDAGEIFRPDWIDGPMRNIKMVRAIGWGKIFTSPLREFSQLVPWDYATYNNEFGVPLRLMVELANRLNVDLWYCFPSVVSDDCVTKITQYFRDNLKPTLTCYYEWGCENWNYGIGTDIDGKSKFRWAQIYGQEKFGATVDQNVAGENYITMRITQIGKIVKDLYAGSGKKYHNTQGIQTITDLNYGKRQIENKLWQTTHPSEYIPFWDVMDSIACTNYISAKVIESRDVLAEIERLANIDPELANEYIYSRMVDPNVQTSLPDWKKAIAQFSNYVRNHPSGPKKLISYEGGFHTIHSHGTPYNLDTEAPVVKTAVYAYESSERGVECIAAMYDIMMKFTDGPVMWLHSTSILVSSGAWGNYLPGVPDVPMERGRQAQSMAMTRTNDGAPVVTDDRYRRTA